MDRGAWTWRGLFLSSQVGACSSVCVCAKSSCAVFAGCNARVRQCIFRLRNVKVVVQPAVCVVAGAFRAHCGRKTPDHFVGSGLASRRMQARQREQSCGLLWLLRYWRKPQTHKHAVPVPHKCCSSAVDLAAWGNQKKSQNYCCVVNWVLLSRGTVVLSLEGTDEHLLYRPRLVFIPPAPGMSHLQSTLWTNVLPQV